MEKNFSERTIVRDGISREELTEERIEELRREYDTLGASLFLDKEEREKNRKDVLAELAVGQDLWVFGYGSLMWNPAVYHDGLVPARIYGFHRSFCLQMLLGRGSPERPGLMLGLDAGGSCQGMIIRIPPDLIESESVILWRREMLSGSYQPTWTTAYTPDGPVRVVTFVVNQAHERYIGDVSHDDRVRMIATAEGSLGRCRDYLSNMVVHMDECGVVDGPMHHLLDEVEAYKI